MSFQNIKTQCRILSGAKRDEFCVARIRKRTVLDFFPFSVQRLFPPDLVLMQVPVGPVRTRKIPELFEDLRLFEGEFYGKRIRSRLIPRRMPDRFHDTVKCVFDPGPWLRTVRRHREIIVGECPPAFFHLFDQSRKIRVFPNQPAFGVCVCRMAEKEKQKKKERK